MSTGVEYILSDQEIKQAERPIPLAIGIVAGNKAAVYFGEALQ